MGNNQRTNRNYRRKKERECSVCHTKETETVPKLEVTEGLSFELNSNKSSYSVTRMGTVTDIDIIIPSSYNNLPVTSIGSYSFYGSHKLKSVTMPDSVTSIGESAFRYCSSLTEVYYTGSATDWSNIIGSENSDLTNVTIYYYSEIQPTDTGDYWHYVDGKITKW